MLRECKECGRPVNRKALGCPHCGAPVPTNRTWAILAVVIVVPILLLLSGTCWRLLAK